MFTNSVGEFVVQTCTYQKEQEQTGFHYDTFVNSWGCNNRVLDWATDPPFSVGNFSFLVFCLDVASTCAWFSLAAAFGGRSERSHHRPPRSWSLIGRCCCFIGSFALRCSVWSKLVLLHGQCDMGAIQCWVLCVVLLIVVAEVTDGRGHLPWQYGPKERRKRQSK